jgi:prepilin-type N-terminal cleavage/methylation domain-containing protein
MLRRIRRLLHREDGFTLIESLVAIAAGSIVLAALVTLLTVTSRWSGDVQEAAVSQTEVRSAMDELARDLRQAYTGDAAVPAVSTMTATDLVFTSPDRATPMHLRRIYYRLSGGRFERAIAVSTNTGAPPWTFPLPGAWVTRAQKIVNAGAFTYLDSAGAPTTDPAAVRTVTVRLEVAAGSGQGTRSAYETSVTLRVAQ